MAERRQFARERGRERAEMKTRSPLSSDLLPFCLCGRVTFCFSCNREGERGCALHGSLQCCEFRSGFLLKISNVMFTNLRLYYLPHHPSLSDYVEHAADLVFFPGFKVDPSVSLGLIAGSHNNNATHIAHRCRNAVSCFLPLSLSLRHPKKNEKDE